MYTRDRMPEGYVPYDTLVVCSNTITGGGVLFQVLGQIPLWIGMGEKPRVWINSVSSLGQALPLVVDSDPAVSNASSFEENGAFGFAINGDLLIRIDEFSARTCRVGELNLFPIGLAIRGDSSGMVIGGTSFSRNKFDGVGVMFNLGGG